MNVLKLAARATADECVQDFMELKEKLESAQEFCARSACASKFLDNAIDPECAEDAQARKRH